MILEELPIRELLMMFLGEEGWRKMESKTKTNNQSFSDYYNLIANTHTLKSRHKAQRLLDKFRAYLEQFQSSSTPTLRLLIIELKRDTQLSIYIFMDTPIYTRGESLATKEV
jgi:hypothetical protein